MTCSLLQHSITSISINSAGVSIFEQVDFELDSRGGLYISDQQSALNFRHRKSAAGYSSDWHVAGDPTLIMISKGTLRLILRDGSSKDFSAGEQFIAADYTAAGSGFDPSIHGHRAEVIGSEELVALHIKLQKR